MRHFFNNLISKLKKPHFGDKLSTKIPKFFLHECFSESCNRNNLSDLYKSW